MTPQKTEPDLPASIGGSLAKGLRDQRIAKGKDGLEEGQIREGLRSTNY